MTLSLRAGTVFTGGYTNDALGISGWRPGEEREVSDEVAGYLLATFPAEFAVVLREPPPTPSRPAKR